jgi:hypothetical protein
MDGVVLGGTVVDERTQGVKHVRRKLDAAGAADLDHLAHSVIDQRRNVRLVA